MADCDWLVLIAAGAVSGGGGDADDVGGVQFVSE